MNRDSRFVLAYFVAITLYFLVFLCEVKGADFDTTTTEVLEIQAVYEFIVIKDTVISTTHHYIQQQNRWYIKGVNGYDYSSDKLPKILKRGK